MKIVRLVLALAILIMATPLSAQQRVKMSFQLLNYLNMPHAEGEMVDLFIHGPSNATGAAIRSHGGIVKQSLPNLVNARVPVAAIPLLAGDPAVERFEFSMNDMVLLNDSARVKSRVNEVHLGMAPLPHGLQGEGVIMGIIDTGLDVTHPDFWNENGDTRVLKYWAQNLTGPLVPAQYGYGEVYDAGHIDNGELPATAYQGGGHGTSVAGIAAGGGTANGYHMGMAPKTHLIAVKIGTGNFRSKVADAVDFIFNEAQALGRPVVVNISLGSQLGSHDGLDAAALMIDGLLQGSNGRVVVCAAGNFNEVEWFDEYHLRTPVTSDTSFTWFRYDQNINFGSAGMGGVLIEAWADAEDLQNVQFAIGADRVVPGYQYRGRTPFHNLVQNAGTILTDTLFSTSGHRLGVVNMLAVPRGGQYQVNFWMVQPDSTTYNFRLMSTGSGLFDVWAPRNHGVSRMIPQYFGQVILPPTVAEYAPMVNYVLPDNEQHITDSWTCSPHVITVANYRNQTEYLAFDGSWQPPGGSTVPSGEITPSSSKGPTRDNRLKPDLGAPGDLTFAAFPMADLAFLANAEPFKLAPGGMHIRGGGTSAASPHVAGIVALYLQHCPTATYTEVIEALLSTAVSDVFTGTTPNIQWGHGKVDAFAAITPSVLDGFQLSLIGSDPFCEGEQVTLLGPSGFDSYAWSTGDTGSALQYGEEGPVSLIAYNASSCPAFSDTLTFTILPAPEAPVVDMNGPMLTSTPAESYQWFLNGVAIDGATWQVHYAYEGGGEYHVWVTDENGCGAASEPVFVLATNMADISEAPLSIWPSPANDHLNVRTAEGGTARFMIHDAKGRKVLEQNSTNDAHTVLSLSGLNGGIYFLQVEQDKEISVYRFVKLP